MTRNWSDEQVSPADSDVFWNTCGGNLVICPLPSGLMRRYHQTCRAHGREAMCIWFFTDDLTEHPLVPVGTAHEGTLFLILLCKLGIRTKIDDRLVIPRYAWQGAAFLWSPELFLTHLPTAEELRQVISEERAAQYRHPDR